MSTQGPFDTGRRDAEGNAYWEMTQHDLESLPGFHREGGTLRSRCPAHRGENASALRVNPDKGVGLCGRCGIKVIITDHPAQRARQEDWERRCVPVVTIGGRPRRLSPPQQSMPTEALAWKPASPPERPTEQALQELREAVTAYQTQFIGSPAETYVGKRHIPRSVARDLGWGWGGDGPVIGLARLDRETSEPTPDDYFRRRVTMPLTGPDGEIVGAFGRSVDTDAKLKYLVTGARRGIKAMVNGAAINRAIAADAPLIVVEGPMDAASIIAGGLPIVVAIGSTTYGHPRHFRGLRHAIILGDNDGEAGSNGARKTRDALELEGVHVTMLDPAITGTYKDIADFWAACGELPAGLIAASRTTAPVSRWAGFGSGDSGAPAPPTPAPSYSADLPVPELAGEELQRLVHRDGISRLTPSTVVRAEVDITVTAILDDPTESPADFAANVVRCWADLSDDDRLAAWLAWMATSASWPTGTIVDPPVDGPNADCAHLS